MPSKQDKFKYEIVYSFYFNVIFIVLKSHNEKY